MENLTITNKALQVLATIKGATDKSITGVSFVSIRNYTNKFGEVSNNLINVGASYEKAKAKDIEFLENFNERGTLLETSFEYADDFFKILKEHNFL